MSVTDTDVRSQYDANGSTTDFTIGFDFTFDTQSEVVVYVVDDTTEVATLQTFGALNDYTLTGGDIANGTNYTTVTFNTAPADGNNVLLIRSTPRTQANDYTNAQAIAAQTHEDAIDKLTRLVQEAGEENDRSIKLRIGSQQTDVFIEDPDAGQLIGWNSAGDGLEAKTSSLTGLSLPSGTGVLVQLGTASGTQRTITGTTDEIDVTNGNGVSDNPTIGLADNPVIPGTEDMVLPNGTTAQRAGTPSAGAIRYNTTTSLLEVYQGGTWVNYAIVGSTGDVGQEGMVNIGFSAGTTSVANDSLTMHGYDGTALSSGNPGYITMKSTANPGQLVRFTFTANVTIDLTGYGAYGGGGDLTDEPLSINCVDDSGTAFIALGTTCQQTVVDASKITATATAATDPSFYLSDAALSGTGNVSIKTLGYALCGFDDTGGSSEDLWSVGTALGDIVLNQRFKKKQRIYLTSDFSTDSTDISDLQIGNLITGVDYKITGHVDVTVDSTDVGVILGVHTAGSGGGTEVQRFKFNGDSTDSNPTYAHTFNYNPSATSLFWYASSITVGTIFRGNSTDLETWVEVEEVNGDVFVTSAVYD